MAREDDLEPYADDDVDDSPEAVRGSRRLLIIVLGVGCLALAISDVVLAIRVTELRRQLVAARAATTPAANAERPPAPPVDTDTPALHGSAQRERPAVATPPRAERLVTDAPDAAASVASPAPSPAAPEPIPAPAPAAEVAPPPPAKSQLPPRPRGAEEPRVAAVTRASPERGAAAPSSRERATASWMVQEYGRADAERRARAVADFYGTHSPDGTYWRRVLAEIARH